jgi:hypothetical protein
MATTEMHVQPTFKWFIKSYAFDAVKQYKCHLTLREARGLQCAGILKGRGNKEFSVLTPVTIPALAEETAKITSKLIILGTWS